MGNMHDLAKLVKDLEEQLVVCIRCGMCQSVCPLFEQTGKESDVARGKLALLDGLMTKIFSDPDGVNDRLNKCLLCGSCAANCPSGVNAVEIFIRARSILTEYKGLSPAKKLVFKQMLSKPKTFNTMLTWAEKFQNLMVRSKKNAQGTSCARFITPMLKDRNFIPMAKTPFHASVKSHNLLSGRNRFKVAFFTGCLIDKIMPQIGTACINVLHHENVDVTVPQDQGCCGIPALASGDRQTFNKLLTYHLDLFREQEFDYLITACATCTSTIKKLWPALYRGTNNSEKSAIEAISSKTMDINQFLIDVVQIQKHSGPGISEARLPETVTYHDPCHLKKSLGVFKQPRQLIAAADYELKEMRDADKCCGMGGSFNLYHYDISTQIGTLKQQNILETGCSIVASGCPACIMQISDVLSKNNSAIQVKHPVELYATSLKLM